MRGSSSAPGDIRPCWVSTGCRDRVSGFGDKGHLAGCAQRQRNRTRHNTICRCAERRSDCGTASRYKRKLIIDLTAHDRLPAIYPFRFHAKDGGLVSYGIDQVDQWRSAATYVDRILRGTDAKDL